MSAATSERSLNRQIVLEEDEYTDALSQIIARDFFPSLVHLDATNSYLDAVYSQNPHLISATVRRLQELSSTPSATARRPFQTPSQTPYAGDPSDTPLRTPGGNRGECPSKRAKFDTGISLDTFQARYTSEDNSSFTQILDEENRKRKESWAWAWDAQKRVEAQRERMLERREMMMIEGPQAAGVREKFLIEIPMPAGLITEGGENSEQNDEAEPEEDSGKGKELAKTQDMREDIDPLAPKKDTREAGVDGWKFKVCPPLPPHSHSLRLNHIRRHETRSCLPPMPTSLHIIPPLLAATPKVILEQSSTRTLDCLRKTKTHRRLVACLLPQAPLVVALMQQLRAHPVSHVALRSHLQNIYGSYRPPKVTQKQ
jgi:hypothetical protein